MQRKGKPSTAAGREHMARVKDQPCALCDASPPSEAHHIDQDNPYSCVALCPDCHRGAINGLHGQRAMWRVRKWSEYDALYRTIERLCTSA